MKIKHGKAVYDVTLIANHSDAIVILTGVNMDTPKALIRNEFDVLVSTPQEDADLNTMRMIEEKLNSLNCTAKVYAKKAIKFRAIADYYASLKSINHKNHNNNATTTRFLTD